MKYIRNHILKDTDYVITSIVFVILLGTIGISNAFAASPISSAVANDPDDVDAVYSIDDTIVIIFPGATNALSFVFII